MMGAFISSGDLSPGSPTNPDAERKRGTDFNPCKKETSMKPTQQLHDLGQSLWLDNITRGLLTDGTLRRYIDELSITGLTSNPSIFDHAIKKSDFYEYADAGAYGNMSWTL